MAQKQTFGRTEQRKAAHSHRPEVVLGHCDFLGQRDLAAPERFHLVNQRLRIRRDLLLNLAALLSKRIARKKKR